VAYNSWIQNNHYGELSEVDILTLSALKKEVPDMPVLTNYWFDHTDFRGNVQFLNESHSVGSWAWINWADIGATRSTLVWERQDDEITVDLAAQMNAPDIQSAVDRLLSGSSGRRTSDIFAGWIAWRDVPYYSKAPSSHGDLDLLVRIFFNLHITTPSYCSDADGNISYYVVPFLDNAGHLAAYVDGWSYDYSGGGLICTGSINDELNKRVPPGEGTLQTLLDERLALFANQTFSLLYLLPGDATKSGGGSVNVDTHVSLALLP
jgi:hypothetical protein